MGIIMDSAIIIKSYNNNIVSVKMNGQERILFGKGIGFRKKLGDKLEKVFIIEDKFKKLCK